MPPNILEIRLQVTFLLENALTFFDKKFELKRHFFSGEEGDREVD
jgi:hypothetical protein